jgi:hypothetical protein
LSEVRHIVIIGAGLAGTVMANNLVKSDAFKVTILEEGTEPAPIYEDKNYVKQRPNLEFTRGKGPSGTANFWHSGLMAMPKDSVWANEMLHEPGWYKAALELIGSPQSVATLSDFKTSSNVIYYPHQRYKPRACSDVNSIFGVSDLEIDPANNIVRYVQLGSNHIQKYDTLVIAAGGIGTPCLLLSELNKFIFPSSLIGKNLTDHISSTPMRIKLDKWHIMRFSTQVQRGVQREGYMVKDSASGLSHNFYIRPAMSIKLNQHTQELKKLLVGFWAKKNRIKTLLMLLSSFDIILEVIANKIPIPFPVRYLAINVVSEQMSPNDNSVSYTNQSVNIDWNFSALERNSVIKACSEYMNGSSLTFADYKIEDPSKIQFTACCHHSGTSPFGESPENSVVDLNLKIHEFENIYICDGSVLPNTSYVNTGLSIIAMSLRLVAHLKDYVGHSKKNTV